MGPWPVLPQAAFARSKLGSTLQLLVYFLTSSGVTILETGSARRKIVLQSEIEPKGQVRVAVIGSGMAGLVEAYLINQDVHSRYAVTLFEQASIASAFKGINIC